MFAQKWQHYVFVLATFQATWNRHHLRIWQRPSGLVDERSILLRARGHKCQFIGIPDFSSTIRLKCVCVSKRFTGGENLTIYYCLLSCLVSLLFLVGISILSATELIKAIAWIFCLCLIQRNPRHYSHGIAKASQLMEKSHFRSVV